MLLVSNNESGLVRQVRLNCISKFLSNLRVNSRKGIVENVNIGFSIKCSGEIDSSSLAARKGDTFVAYDRHVTFWEELDVARKSGQFNDFVVFLLVVRRSKENVLADGADEDPCFLRAV